MIRIMLLLLCIQVAGGTESHDWAQMLYRMYIKWANANGFKVKELDYLEGEEAE